MCLITHDYGIVQASNEQGPFSVTQSDQSYGGGLGVAVSLAHSGSAPNQKYSVTLNFYMHADLDDARSSKNFL